MKMMFQIGGKNLLFPIPGRPNNFPKKKQQGRTIIITTHDFASVEHQLSEDRDTSRFGTRYRRTSRRTPRPRSVPRHYTHPKERTGHRDLLSSR